MPSFSIPLTGLQADSVALSTIGNNLANLNTTAFKEQTAQFSDLFYDSIGTSGSNQKLQVGIGTRVSSIDTNFSQGTLATTGVATDMAINGSGFFVVNNGGTTQLTRSGDFQLSPTGDLITSDGFHVQGYPVVNGVVSTDSPLGTINIPTAATQLAHATTSFSTTTGLDSGAATGTVFNSSLVTYDSLGAQHNLDVTYTKTGSNTWNYSVNLPAGDATGATGNTGTLTFNPNGTLASPTGDVTGISFTGLTDGSNDISLTWKLRDANGNSMITQSAVASSNNANLQDGYASGTYKSFSVDAGGVITASFSNGATEVLGQVAVATVPNEEGLTRNGDNLYAVSEASGAIQLGVAGSGGRGAITDSSLEESNIDISTEFANLIVAQRAFEANSKTVTAFDTVTQDTINLIR